ncbi:MAG TPA: hypothetical protein VJT84_08040 [Gaiellaceae bacterium]|nr:hypothetical protein [Gaiellaceae bacterium]
MSVRNRRAHDATRAVALAFAVLAAAFAAGCGAEGGKLVVGVVDDTARAGPPGAFIDGLTKGGFDALAISSIWEPGETEPDEAETEALRLVAAAADAAGVRLFIIVYQPGSATTPLIAETRSAFADYAAAVAGRLETVHDLIVGNEPNLNRFWLPQFGPDGDNVSAGAYLDLLGETYDRVKAARDDVRIWGGATAPRGADRPRASRQTTSPTAFIRALGDAYRRSGRSRPVMDGFVHHPYPESANVPIDLPHPNVTSIGLADHGKLVRLLSEAFDGTAQKGTDLPILYGEIGIETPIPATKRAAYTEAEIAATASEGEQAAAYRRTLELAVCQGVAGVLFFHLQDEVSLIGWQSGIRYADATPKESFAPVRAAVTEARDGKLDTRCGS